VATSYLNQALLRLQKRAEGSGSEKLIRTFVDVGPLFSLLSSEDHQVVFGRRGTGKTHAFRYLAEDRKKNGDAVAMIDLRNVGSSAGIYADDTIPAAERATRLLVDVLSAIHDALLSFFIENDIELDLSVAGPALDTLANSITQVRVVGTVEAEQAVASASHTEKNLGLKSDLSARGPSIGAQFNFRSTSGIRLSSIERRSGEEQLYVNFGSTGAAFRGIAERLKGRRLWVLLDEWSSIPLSLQPYLADLVRRSLFPVAGFTIKIAAIEQRSTFRTSGDAGNFVGIELGADAAADINLDDFMVFDNNASRAKEFFQRLIAQHVKAVVSGTDLEAKVPMRSKEIIGNAFTEKRALEEFVRACEGVPRDAINIIALAAQRALENPISVQHVRVAAGNWYQRDKEKNASANEEALRLLHWIIDEVIGERRARAFLLQRGINAPLIEDLYDCRVLHVLKRGISTHDQPGVRYDVYKLDYGCYVDLISTAKAPQGLLPVAGEDGTDGYIDVPPDDYRSIRRAILDLGKFYGE